MPNCLEACRTISHETYHSQKETYQHENKQWILSGLVMVIALLVPGILGLSGVAAIAHTSSCVLTAFGSVGAISFVLGMGGFLKDVHENYHSFS